MQKQLVGFKSLWLGIKDQCFWSRFRVKF